MHDYVSFKNIINTLSRILRVVYFLFFNVTQQVRFCSSYSISGDKKRSGEGHRRKNPTCVKKKTKKTVQLLIRYHQSVGEKKH
jgi:hypothetical protein